MLANELFGTEYPIAAFSHCRDVVAAVSRAGGLGVLGAVTYTPEHLDVELTWIEEQVGDRPYGVDLLLPVATADVAGRVSAEDLEALLVDPSPILPEEHRKFVARLLDEHGIPELPDGGAEARRLLIIRPQADGRLHLGPNQVHQEQAREYVPRLG